MSTTPFEPGTEPFPDPDAPPIPDPMTDPDPDIVPPDPDIVPPDPGTPDTPGPETQPEPV